MEDTVQGIKRINNKEPRMNGKMFITWLCVVCIGLALLVTCSAWYVFGETKPSFLSSVFGSETIFLSPIYFLLLLAAIGTYFALPSTGEIYIGGVEEY